MSRRNSLKKQTILLIPNFWAAVYTHTHIFGFDTHKHIWIWWLKDVVLYATVTRLKTQRLLKNWWTKISMKNYFWGVFLKWFSKRTVEIWPEVSGREREDDGIGKDSRGRTQTRDTRSAMAWTHATSCSSVTDLMMSSAEVCLLGFSSIWTLMIPTTVDEMSLRLKCVLRPLTYGSTTAQ